jgi:triosephosphate isomerase (TIM)
MTIKKFRKPIVAGNWKMNKVTGEAGKLAEDIKRIYKSSNSKVDVVLCPPFTALQAVSEAIAGSEIGLGAQNMHWELSGAYTGEISTEMLRDLYCHYVILGHSERRQLFGETDDAVNKKVKAALSANFYPIICVGETLKQREKNETENIISSQVKAALQGIDKNKVSSVIFAYEPIWAIGTGKTATPEQAQQVHKFIRDIFTELYDEKTAHTIRIQYGGSVKPANAKELFEQSDIDGGLIGGAALDAESFLGIVNSVPKL